MERGDVSVSCSQHELSSLWRKGGCAMLHAAPVIIHVTCRHGHTHTANTPHTA
jgi:hypothetical protein